MIHPDPVMSPEEVGRAQLALLREQHRALDARIEAESAAPAPCAFTLQRLKREKLALKDRIARLSDQLTPDIIA